jgi:hypothetical protein
MDAVEGQRIAGTYISGNVSGATETESSAVLWCKKKDIMKVVASGCMAEARQIGGNFYVFNGMDVFQVTVNC